MFVRCIGTGSKGNSYAIYNNNEILLLDLGLPKREIVKALNYNISNIVGCIVSHSHLDHAKAVKDFVDMGISVFKSYGIKTNTQNKWLGSFQITTFDLPHNGTENRGFFIRTLDNQKILYMTDFEYCRYNFIAQKVNHILIECNYQQELVSRDLPNFEHKIRGHASLDTCKNFIAANKTNALRTVILCHMGAETCDSEIAVKEVKEVVGNQAFVDVAEKGKCFELSLLPF